MKPKSVCLTSIRASFKFEVGYCCVLFVPTTKVTQVITYCRLVPCPYTGCPRKKHNPSYLHLSEAYTVDMGGYEIFLERIWHQNSRFVPVVLIPRPFLWTKVEGCNHPLPQTFCWPVDGYGHSIEPLTWVIVYRSLWLKSINAKFKMKGFF